MSMTDPIADLLTRIRNANLSYHERVEVPSSKLKRGIVHLLKEEGYIRNYRVLDDHKQGTLRIYLKYGPNRERIITRIERVSKSSVRVYVGKENVRRVLGGLGISIISTSRGLLTDQQARRLGVGGEVLCRVW